VHAVVVASDGARADVRARADARVAQVRQVHGLDAFAENALLHFHEISHARVFFQARAVAEMRERPDLRPAREVARNHHRVRLDEHVVFEHGVSQHAAGANRAARADARFSQELHARLDARVRADGDFRIDQHRLRHLDRHARIHYGGAFTPSKHRIHSGQISARVASKDFVRIGGEDGLHILAFPAQRRDRVGQVQLFVNVLRFQRSEARPQFFKSEAVDAGIDFMDRALIAGERRILDDGVNGTAVAAHNSPVARGIFDFSGKNRGSGAAFPVRAREGRERLRAD